ncbi:Nn.00g026740.m01.CDS01 [Neocucurbitaria sp. VM-36]
MSSSRVAFAVELVFVPQNYRKRYRRRGTENRGFVATLSPEAQIHKVIADINNLKGGTDLRNWSAAARKELSSSITITLEIERAGKHVKIEVPKLALLVASPKFRAHMVQDPAAQKLGIIHQDISLDSIKIIANWLKDVCDNVDFPLVPVPEELGEVLRLRLTALKLGMQQYVHHIQEHYVRGVQSRIPSLVEITIVIDNTRAKYENDPVVVGLANRLDYLRRHHKVSPEEEMAFAKLLADEKFDRLVAKVQQGVVVT